MIRQINIKEKEKVPKKLIGSKRAVEEIPPVDKNSIKKMTEVNNSTFGLYKLI